MKYFLLSISIFSISIFAKAQSTFSGTLTTSDSTYNRVVASTPPTLLSGVGTDVYYHVITITIAVPGSVTFTCSSPDFDSFGTLYGTGGFDPYNALTNALTANDDSIQSDFGFSYYFQNPGVYFLVVSTFDNAEIGSYTITSTAGAVLPLRLLSFSAGKIEKLINEIKWTTSEEINIDFYKVQHSINGRNFSDLPVANIPASNTGANLLYRLRDTNPNDGYNFYRLKIIERSGHISYGPIAVINNTEIGLSAVNIFPNPATNIIQVESENWQNDQFGISLTNAAGQILFLKEYKENRQRIIPIDLKKISTGIYFLKIKTKDGVVTKSFLKQ